MWACKRVRILNSTREFHAVTGFTAWHQGEAEEHNTLVVIPSLFSYGNTVGITLGIPNHRGVAVPYDSPSSSHFFYLSGPRAHWQVWQALFPSWGSSCWCSDYWWDRLTSKGELRLWSSLIHGALPALGPSGRYYENPNFLGVNASIFTSSVPSEMISAIWKCSNTPLIKSYRAQAYNVREFSYYNCRMQISNI